jgi:hypothetical protein
MHPGIRMHSSKLRIESKDDSDRLCAEFHPASSGRLGLTWDTAGRQQSGCDRHYAPMKIPNVYLILLFRASP